MNKLSAFENQPRKHKQPITTVKDEGKKASHSELHKATLLAAVVILCPTPSKVMKGQRKPRRMIKNI